jgi:hypothetical protein
LVVVVDAAPSSSWLVLIHGVAAACSYHASRPSTLVARLQAAAMPPPFSGLEIWVVGKR